MKNPTLQTIKYVVWDSLAALMSYAALYYYRKVVIEQRAFGLEQPDLTLEMRFYVGLSLTALFWLSLYWMTGFYNDIFRRSRLRDIFQTFNSSLFGSVIIFFALILDDWVKSYKDYYESFLIYFGAIFILTSLFRFIISSNTNRKIQKRKIWFNYDSGRKQMSGLFLSIMSLKANVNRQEIAL